MPRKLPKSLPKPERRNVEHLALIRRKPKAGAFVDEKKEVSRRKCRTKPSREE